MRIEYVGHATVVVDLDEVRLVTDPLLRNRVAHLQRAVPVDSRAMRGVDAVLISHAHYDHLDLPSLEKLGKKLPVVVLAPHDQWREKTMSNLQEVKSRDGVSIVVTHRQTGATRLAPWSGAVSTSLA